MREISHDDKQQRVHGKRVQGGRCSPLSLTSTSRVHCPCHRRGLAAACQPRADLAYQLGQEAGSAQAWVGRLRPEAFRAFRTAAQ